MRITCYNTPANALVPFPDKGSALRVKLHGDDRWHDAIALDRPRKLWCSMTLDGKPFIADESSIEVWEHTDIPEPQMYQHATERVP